MFSVRQTELFTDGGSQAVRLPQEFRFDGNRVSIRKVGNAVILEPLKFDVEAWFQSIDALGDTQCMEAGRRQPQAPVEDFFF